jgi:hypothetical protein
MAGESAKDTGQDQADSLIDDLITEILSESSASSQSAGRGRASASLLETAFVSKLTGPKASMLERLLIAEAFGSALADALAPALADLLAPRLVKYLEQLMAGESSGKGPAKAGSPSGTARKSGG